MKKKSTLLTPQNANTSDDILRLKRDTLTLDDFWILVDSYEVHLGAQVEGWAPTARISIPKKTFDRLVKFYETGK